MLLTHPAPGKPGRRHQDRVEIPSLRRTAPRDRKAYELAKARALVLATDDNRTLIRNLETVLAKGSPANDAANRYAYALALRQAGRYQEAQTQIARLLKNDPDRLALRLESGRTGAGPG